MFLLTLAAGTVTALVLGYVGYGLMELVGYAVVRLTRK